MRDEELRTLRRELEAGGVGAELAWLRASLRVGRINEENLRLAAFCGSPSALSLLVDRGVCSCGLSRRAPLHTKRCALFPQRMAETRNALRIPSKFEPWCRCLELHGSHAVGRAAVAIMIAFSEAYSELAALREPAIPLVESWLACPCPEHLEPVAKFAEAWDRRGSSAEYSVWFFVTMARFEWPLDSGAGINSGHWSLEIAKRARVYLESEAIREAITRELIPWALGLGDPVAARVAARAHRS